jgi:hypothetical protein
MTLDEEVLTQTKEIREQLLSAERELEHLRADYHHSIRLLHARGGNMREIADALLLSHQRVHQIVGADDGEPAPAGPERGGRGRGPHGRRGHQGHVGPGGRHRRGPFNRFTAEAEETVSLASRLARELAHPAVEAPHLLLALVETEPRVAGAVDAEELRGKVAAAYPQADGPRRGRMRFGHTAKHSIALALHEAAEHGDGAIEARHLALALTREGAPRETIVPLGVDVERLRNAFPEEND